MKRIKILLDDITKLKNFINIVPTFDSDIDAIKGRYTLDGKSLMGIMTLDLSEPIEVEILSDNIDEIRKFDAVMDQFAVR